MIFERDISETQTEKDQSIKFSFQKLQQFEIFTDLKQLTDKLHGKNTYQVYSLTV